MNIIKYYMIILILIFAGYNTCFADPLFRKSYALIIGINKYENSKKFKNLNNAVNDAKELEIYLKNQGFDVTSLYDKSATRKKILGYVYDKLGSDIKERDRFLFYFAGHGYVKKNYTSGEEYGYIVPYDGDESSTSHISSNDIKYMSDILKAANHQLFIFDSCYGGAMTLRSGILSELPSNIEDLIKRKAFQILTSGGKNQPVIDGGIQNHSLFSGQLLRALRDGFGDQNKDGFITFKELDFYLSTAASNDNQTPGSSILPGHEQGDFIFINHKIPNINRKYSNSNTVNPKYRRSEDKSDNSFGIIEIKATEVGDLYVDAEMKRKLSKNEVFRISKLEEKTYDIKLKLEDDRSFEKNITVKNGEITRVILPLSLSDSNVKFGSLSICTPDFDGQLFLDGEFLSEIIRGEHKIIPNIPVGTHEVSIKKNNEIVVIEFLIKENEVACINGGKPFKVKKLRIQED